MSNSPRVSVVISFLNSEKFLSLNSTYIAEHVLEIGDDKYTKKFGKDKVMKSVPTAMCWRLSAFSKGLSAHEFSERELDYYDRRYQMLITVKAPKQINNR